MPDRPIILETKNVSLSFGAFEVLKDASLSVSSNRIVGIIGPNGAGKTTYLNVLIGKYRCNHGGIYIDGVDCTHTARHKRVGLGLIKTSQLTSLFMRFSVRENFGAVLFSGRKINSKSRLGDFDDIIYEIFDLMDVEFNLDSLVSELSHGDQRILEIALALIMEPKILVLDEPTAGMSPSETDKFINLINNKIKGRCTIILIEHDMNVIQNVVDELAVLHHGKFLIQGATAEVMKDRLVNEVYLGNYT